MHSAFRHRPGLTLSRRLRRRLLRVRPQTLLDELPAVLVRVPSWLPRVLCLLPLLLLLLDRL